MLDTFENEKYAISGFYIYKMTSKKYYKCVNKLLANWRNVITNLIKLNMDVDVRESKANYYTKFWMISKLKKKKMQ